MTESRMKRLRHAVELAGVRLAIAAAGTLPDRAAHAVGAGLGRFAFDVLRVRRSVSAGHIRATLGVSDAESIRIARAAYANLGRCLLDFCALRRLSSRELLDRVDFEGFENLERAHAAGRGAVLVSGHFGDWEWMSPIACLRGLPLDIVVGQQTNPRVDDVMNDLRRRHGCGIIAKSGALRRVLQSLGEGKVVSLLADQDARKGGVVIDFLGLPASTVRGPALFSIRRGSPIIPTVVLPEGARHRFILGAPMVATPGLDEDAAIADLTQRYTDWIAAWIRKHPEHYFWAHKRWKSTRGQQLKNQPVANAG